MDWGHGGLPGTELPFCYLQTLFLQAELACMALDVSTLGDSWLVLEGAMFTPRCPSREWACGLQCNSWAGATNTSPCTRPGCCGEAPFAASAWRGRRPLRGPAGLPLGCAVRPGSCPPIAASCQQCTSRGRLLT